MAERSPATTSGQSADRQAGAVVERLALLYSDGSAALCRDSESITLVRRQRDEDDANETRPEHLTVIARVRCEVLEIVDTGRAPPPPSEVERLRQRVAELEASLAQVSGEHLHG